MSTTYKDPAKETLSNGRPISDLMRAGPAGIKGVIISPATPGGIPENFDPHDRANLQITIEPDSGNSQNLKLERITADAVQQALKLAKKRVSGADINSIRERTAVAFEELAKITNSGVKKVSSAKNNTTAEPYAEQAADLSKLAVIDDDNEIKQLTMPEAPVLPPIDTIDRAYSPMAAFGLKKQTNIPSAQAAVSAPGKAGPPQKLVYFEKEGIGTVPAFFHDVIVSVSRPEPDSPEEAGFLVLIYDLRFEQSAARWFPPANDPYQRPWAVKINEDRRLYLVHTTGFQYVYDNTEFCVLLVEKAFRQPITEI